MASRYMWKLKKLAKTDERKKIRRAKRKIIGYDDTAPEMCGNCLHFKDSFKKEGKYFSPRCEKHKLAVVKHAICNDWTDDETKNLKVGL